MVAVVSENDNTAIPMEGEAVCVVDVRFKNGRTPDALDLVGMQTGVARVGL